MLAENGMANCQLNNVFHEFQCMDGHHRRSVFFYSVGWSCFCCCCCGVFPFRICSSLRTHPSNRFVARSKNLIRRTSFAAAIAFAFFFSCLSYFVAVAVTGRESVCVVCCSTHTQIEYPCHNHKLINVTRLFISFISYSFFAPNIFMCGSENSGARKKKT